MLIKVLNKFWISKNNCKH